MRNAGVFVLMKLSGSGAVTAAVGAVVSTTNDAGVGGMVPTLPARSFTVSWKVWVPSPSGVGGAPETPSAPPAKPLDCTTPSTKTCTDAARTPVPPSLHSADMLGVAVPTTPFGDVTSPAGAIVSTVNFELALPGLPV